MAMFSAAQFVDVFDNRCVHTFVGYWTSSMPAALVENANSAYSRSQTAAFCSFTFADRGKAL
jgi:predicted component of type VI protein secretion system